MGNKWVHNSAVLTECSAMSLNLGATKVFSWNGTSGELGALQNATALRMNATPQCMRAIGRNEEHQQHQDRKVDTIVTMGDCGKHQTRWHFDNATGRLSSLDVPNMCVAYYTGKTQLPAFEPSMVVTIPCNSTLDTTNLYSMRWVADPSLPSSRLGFEEKDIRLAPFFGFASCAAARWHLKRS